MKLTHIAAVPAVLMLLHTTTANELPPSEVTPHDLLSPRQHADLYINLITIIYSELIPLQDSVTDAESAAAVAARTESLHSRLNIALSHILNNPDMAREVTTILQQDPSRRAAFEQLSRRFILSWQRCRATGLITTREFNRHMRDDISTQPTDEP